MLRAGIIGCNGVSGLYDQNFFERKDKFSITHASGYFLSESCNLVSVCDPDEDRLTKFRDFWKLKNVYSCHREMLLNEKLDIVSICVPTENHYEVFCDAINFGVKGIFCEKPLSINQQEANRMQELAKKNNVKVSVNYFRRWNKSINKLKSSIREGEFGNLIKGIFKYTKTTSGNACHLMDLANWFFDEPTKISLDANSIDIDRLDFEFLYADSSGIKFINIPNNDSYIFIDCELFFESMHVSISQRGQFISISPIGSDKIYDNFKIIDNQEPFEADWKNAPLRAINNLDQCIKSDLPCESPIHDSIILIKQLDELKKLYMEQVK